MSHPASVVLADVPIRLVEERGVLVQLVFEERLAERNLHLALARVEDEICHQQQQRVALPKQAVAAVQYNRAVQPMPVSKPGRGGTMKPATLVSIGCLATACWIGSVSHAEACSCSPPETLVARDRSFAVFEGTVVDQRITLIPSLRILAAEQAIVVGRVWKGEVTNQVSVLYLEHGMCSGATPVGATALFFMVQGEGRLAYGLCSSGVPIADAAPALAKLGPPIATFDDDPVEVLFYR